MSTIEHPAHTSSALVAEGVMAAGPAGAKRHSRRLARTTLALALAAGGVVVAVPAAQANACGVWSEVSPSAPIDIDGQHVGDIYNEWNNCSGSGYQVKAYWAWDNTWRTESHTNVGITGAWVTVSINANGPTCALASNAGTQKGPVGSLLEPSVETTPVAGESNSYNLWQAEAEITVTYSSGSGNFFASTDTHNYNGGQNYTWGSTHCSGPSN